MLSERDQCASCERECYRAPQLLSAALPAEKTPLAWRWGQCERGALGGLFSVRLVVLHMVLVSQISLRVVVALPSPWLCAVRCSNTPELLWCILSSATAGLFPVLGLCPTVTVTWSVTSCPSFRGQNYSFLTVTNQE